MTLHTERTVDTAANWLRTQILDGRFQPGDKLPPERALSEDLGISRLTLRAALARLEAEGLVKARQGSGVAVLDYEEQAGVELLPHLMAQERHEPLMAPFLVLRRAIATEAVALACVKATEEDLDALQQLADRLAHEPDRAALEAGNLAFAAEVVRLADNLPMKLLFNTVARVLEARTDVRKALVLDEAGARASYGLVVALLRQRDPDTARTLVRQALEAIDTQTLAVLEAS